jgi:nitrogen fixation-related uncharacterized protein
MLNWQSAARKLVTPVLVILILLLLFWTLGRENFNHLLNASWRILDEDSYFKQYTLPLRPGVARDLCTQFEIPDSDFRCRKEKVYATDFYPAIVEYYSSRTGENRTLSAVQEKIGKYQTEAEKRRLVDDTYYYWQ